MIWVQVGTVSDAVYVAQSCRPDVLVIQGTDAGAHGLAQGAGNVTLLPEVADALQEVRSGEIPLVAAGGIVEGRGAAASIALGAYGVAMGTRILASDEAAITNGYQNDVIQSRDGGSSTIRTNVYDRLRGTIGWPSTYNGRGIINLSFREAQNGKSEDENRTLYEDQGWGDKGD